MSIHEQVIDHMMDHDAFSKWMGIEVLETKEGYYLSTLDPLFFRMVGGGPVRRVFLKQRRPSRAE